MTVTHLNKQHFKFPSAGDEAKRDITDKGR